MGPGMGKGQGASSLGAPLSLHLPPCVDEHEISLNPILLGFYEDFIA